MSIYSFYQESSNGRPLSFDLSKPEFRLEAKNLQKAAMLFAKKRKYKIDTIDRLLDGNARFYYSEKGWMNKNEGIYLVRIEE